MQLGLLFLVAFLVASSSFVNAIFPGSVDTPDPIPWQPLVDIRNNDYTKFNRHLGEMKLLRYSIFLKISSTQNQAKQERRRQSKYSHYITPNSTVLGMPRKAFPS
jgi:hypothetical protein